MIRSIRKTVGCLAPLLWLCGAASLASGELIIIYDNGHARPLSDFLGPLKRAGAKKKERTADKNQLLGAANVQLLLPIRSAGLTVGKVAARPHSVPFARPFFLIGSDPWSKRWLVEHRLALRGLGAVGMLVEATTVENLQDIARLADGLSITPASGSDIANAIGIEHYPVGISAGQIWQ